MKSTDAELLSIAADARERGRVEEANHIAREAIRMPAEGADCVVVASVSGGKDSTALILALREAQIPAYYVFADTGWEARETYEYLSLLESKLAITIDKVQAIPKSDRPSDDIADERGYFSAAIDRFYYRAGFPGRMSRFCTRELKLEPLRAYHDNIETLTGKETISAIGVRRQESEARSQVAEWVDEGPRFTRHRWGGFIWRPLAAWTIEDVLLIHRRHGIPVNPLYQRGHDRVGCYPCIFSNKDEIRLIADESPERIDLIERLEAKIRVERTAANERDPGRFKHADDASFFQTQRKGFSGIRKVVEWARTDYGGKQMQIFAPKPTSGCMKWGLCDVQLPDGDTTGTSELAPEPRDERRFFEVDFDTIWFSVVARDHEHVHELLRKHYKDAFDNDYDERRAECEPLITELTHEMAAAKMIWDERRSDDGRTDTQRFAFNTFELGAVASSEY